MKSTQTAARSCRHLNYAHPRIDADECTGPAPPRFASSLGSKNSPVARGGVLLWRRGPSWQFSHARAGLQETVQRLPFPSGWGRVPEKLGTRQRRVLSLLARAADQMLKPPALSRPRCSIGCKRQLIF